MAVRLVISLYPVDSMLILASSSPRRHALLEAANIRHIVRFAEVQEVRREKESALDFVRRLAQEKAQAVYREEEDVVLGADTIVCCDEEILGKPSDSEDAARMLRLLAGRDHWVHTGICILSNQRSIVDVVSTKVSFLPLSEEEVQEYTRSGESLDKAGAYAIQGRASRFVSSVEGCYHNVVGLPVSLVYSYLKSL